MFGTKMARMFALAVLPALLLAACSGPERLSPVTAEQTERARPLGLANARFFPDNPQSGMLEEGAAAVRREEAAWRAAGNSMPLPPANFLAISGGGDNGAFGSGLLVGWTAAGTRPQFKLVTGVSTGSLIAPFAFLGPAYDKPLEAVYTTITPPQVFRSRGLIGGILNDALSDTSPLAETIARYMDEKMVAAIAQEYGKGRLLLIGTTNLDAQRPVIWNIGAIAASGHPGSLGLIRQILRASSAVPGVFQPVLIDVEFDGKKHQEMHVDGGAMAQLFLYPPSLHPGVYPRGRTAYIIRNARLDPEWAETEPRTLSIAGRAISTMLASSGHNDVLRVYFITQRDQVDYNLAFIGRDFDVPHKEEFDQTFMKALYQYGYDRARAGYKWHKQPPGLETPTAAPAPARAAAAAPAPKR
ncbi:MAG: patatin-like phospholipase family protein [Reyranellaceae bacterium]